MNKTINKFKKLNLYIKQLGNNLKENTILNIFCLLPEICDNLFGNENYYSNNYSFALAP